MSKIGFPLKRNMVRTQVFDLQVGLRLLGYPIDETESTRKRYGKTTFAAVHAFQTQHHLPATGEVDQATAVRLNETLAQPGTPATPSSGIEVPEIEPQPVPAGRRVQGTVRHTDNTPIDAMKVRAFNRRVGGEDLLGESKTKDRGNYTIGYPLPAGVSVIDLFVRAYDDEEEIVAVSAIAIGAGAFLEGLNLSVDDPRFRGPSEFARTTKALSAHVGAAQLAQLNADDVALLVRRTGAPRSAITAWIASRRLAERADVEHEAMYGLVRVERTAALPRLLRRSPARLRRSLLEAAEINLIARSWSRRAEAIALQLKQLAVDMSAARQTPASLGRLLATAGKASIEQQRNFIERYARHKGPVREFWTALRKDPAFGDEAVDDVQLSLQLGTLTANHPPLVKALRARGMRHAAEVATLDAQGWRELLKAKIDDQSVGTPTNIKGETNAERSENYVTLLRERSALAFPTAHVNKTLKTLPDWKASTAVAFLDANPDFDLKKANIKQHLRSANATLRSSWDKAKLEGELATLQRVTRVAPAGREETVVNGLLTQRYSSAQSIARTSRTSFVRQSAAALGGEAAALKVHRNAQFQTSRAQIAYGLMHPAIGGPTVSAIGSISNDVATDATWASLFGNIDYCACAHCRSLYSPAAYFVDLLAWLDTHELKGKTAFEVLDERRADLKHIELSCENTNTVLPYVDLSNEILEVLVLNPSGSDASAPVAPQASTGTSPELLANPEYLRPEVYDRHLARAVFPIMLPFDLWGELGRVYFEHLGVRRCDLMEALRRRATPSSEAIDAERLGFSRTQWRILTGAAQDEPWEYWGYRSGTPGGIAFTDDLGVVSKFLDRAGLEYEDLLDLLHARFINPGGIRITGAECNTDEMKIGPLNEDDAGRMHRFLRVWRNRGITMLELDKTLHALGVTSVDAAGLGRLADLDRVQALVKTPLLDILCWWSQIDTYADRPEKDVPVKSLYERVYLNRAVDANAEAPEFPFALDSTRSALANTVNWDDVRSLLQAALALDADELSLLIDETVDGQPNPQRVVGGSTATLEDLSALYRHVSLARALRLRVEEMLGLLRLTGINPFDVADAAATVALIETVADIRADDFSLDELHYLLEHDALAETRVGITDEAIAQTLIEMRDGLVRVATDYAVIADPTGENTARYLAVLLDADAAAAVMAALQTPADGTNNAELAAVLNIELDSLFSFDAATLIEQPPEQRFNTLVSMLGPYLRDTQSNAGIIDKVSTLIGRALDSVEDLLAVRITMSVDANELSALVGLRVSPYVENTASTFVAADDPEAFAALRRAWKAAQVLTKLGVDIEEQVWLFDVGVLSGLASPVALPIAPQPIASGIWAAWARLVDLFALRKDLPGGEPSLVALLQRLVSTDDAAIAEESFRSDLAARTGWLREDIDTLISAFGLAFPDDWHDGTALRRLVVAFASIRRAGASAAQADAWATALIDAPQAEALRLLAKSKHDEARWPSVARALRDPVRDKQRAALVAYLIADRSEYADEEDLYSDLLIDVEMDPCMLTSRIKQAISSVQLFVQRALLNLEKDVDLTRDDVEQWKWMQNYRVWEAARKVFLYAENWMEEELRPDKSPLFEQLENALLQGNVDDAAVEKACTAYLEGLIKIARLEVMGVYHEYEDVDNAGSGKVDILHVVARTRGHPREHYYRQRIDAREWTPWVKLDADIEANHIVLAVAERRLFLIWPVVVQKAEGNEERTTNFFEMKLAWIERMNEQWGPRKLSEEFLTVAGKWEELDFGAASEEVSSAGEWLTYFRISDEDPLTIECRQAFSAALGANMLGRFIMDACTGSFVADDKPQGTGYELVGPPISVVQRMRFALCTGVEAAGTPTPLTLMIGPLDDSKRLIGDAEEIEVLGKVDTRGLGTANDDRDGRVAASAFGSHLYPHQYGDFVSQHGVFLDDDHRTFHVMPETVTDWPQSFASDSLDPSIVNTTESKSDVFSLPPAEPAFEPAIPWDKHQDVPPTSDNIARADGAQTSEAAIGTNNAAAGIAVAGDVLVGSKAFTDTLKSSELQASQSVLLEVAHEADALAFPRTTKYRFSLFYHPYVCDFMTELRRFGVAGLYDPDPDGSGARLVRQQKSLLEFFEPTYEPTDNVLLPYPVQDIDFGFGGAYEMYNWEAFFHMPFLIASRLSQNQRFEEARRWFHFVFDPTNRTPDDDPLRFWKIKPFYREPDAPISEFLALAASEDVSAEADAARTQYDQQVDAWLKDPFNPWAIGRLRTTAMQKALVMKYLDNLIAWGDQLFRQDTIETVNQALQLYVLALELLGERPDALPPRAEPAVKTFEQVREDLAASVLNNPLVQLENLIFTPRALTFSIPSITQTANTLGNLVFPLPTLGAARVVETGSESAGSDFYFCIPPNDKLLGYWDTVEDRLFKIRHCMNIEGVVRQLPLFEPAIDPGALVRARAAGVDLSSALADLNAPLPHYRFSYMLQKAYALNQTVRGLGAALLSAMEKQDAEALARLRANQEVALMEAVRQVKKSAIDEARHSLAAAERSLEVVQQRRDYFQKLVNTGRLPEEKSQEQALKSARMFQLLGSGATLLGPVLTLIPEIKAGVAGMSSPVTVAKLIDGLSLAKAVELAGQGLSMIAGARSADASIAALSASFGRRSEEWKHQSEIAATEIKQLQKQIAAAEVRVALAERDLENHERQIDNARSVREFMEHKFTNLELYQWMVGQLSSLYFQSYQLVYDLAKKAERAYRHELAISDASFIQFGYWDSLKKGLLAGERLQYDIERMDAAFLENNRRDYEITQHVSLALLDPVALLKLQTEGECEFSLPEALFDLHYPGQFLRRTKSVSVTVPCVTGPYTGVPLRLTLVSSRTRIDPSAAGNYPFDEAGDGRFQIQTGAVQSIVCSIGRDDAGVFSPDHRDERYLPCEGCGVISDWNLKLISAIPTFDWLTITDIVLHLRYIAREGGELLRDAALASLSEQLSGIPLRKAFSAKREYPSEWNAFLRPAADATEAVLKLDLAENRFPYIAQNANLSISNLDLIALVHEPEEWAATDVAVSTAGREQTVLLASSAESYAGHPGAAVPYASAAPGLWEFSISTASLGAPSTWIDDFIVVATYQLELT